MSTALPLSNYIDANGTPVCPTCGRSILAQHAVMRVDDCMIHAWCFEEANGRDTPCEPEP
jgi:hypothetical protein